MIMAEEKSPFLEDAGDQGSDTDDEVLFSKHSKLYPKGKKRLLCCFLSGIVVLSLVLAFVAGAAIGHYTLPKLVSGLLPSPPPCTSSSSCSTSANSSTDSHSIANDICANPPVLLISLDGFRSEYLNRNLTPFLHSLAGSGVRAMYMRSEFPTSTFPNHFSIVTGLHPESHGIVNNKFYDVDLQEEFEMMNISTVRKPQWWLAEPLWVTAVKQGLKTAVFSWPGAEIDYHGIRPTIYYTHINNASFEERARTVVSWFDLPTSKRPQFMVSYFYPVDHAGHEGGPNSKLVNDSLVYVDGIAESIFAGLEKRGVKECVNTIIISDHGMARLGTRKFVNLSKLLPKKVIDNVHIVTDPATGIYVPDGNSEMIQMIYNILVKNGTEAGLPFRAYLRNNVPLRLHMGHFNKQRYGDIILICEEGSDIEVERNNRTHAMRGLHGYDNILKDVQATFIAHGPAFRKGYVAEAFANTEVYNLMCGLLGVDPLPNNGTAGSLYHLLTPSLLPTLPPPQALSGTPGIVDSCPYPIMDEETLSRRSFCKECVCRNEEQCADVSRTVIDDSNTILNLLTDDMTESQLLHFPWGVPSGGEGSSSCLLTQQNYITLYSNTLHIPLWTAFKLHKQASVEPPSVSSCLRRDPRVPPLNSSNCTDYSTGGGFIAVRLAAAAALSRSTHSTLTQQLTTNLLSNTVPQVEKFNRRVWVPLQRLLRSWANSSTIHVMLGSVLDINRDGTRDNDQKYTWWVNNKTGGVAIPTHFYAVVVRCVNDRGLEPADCKPEQLDAVGMLFQHPTEPGDPSPTSKLLRFSLTPIRDIETVTGVNFFPNLSTQQQNILELRIANKLWTTSA